LGSYIIRRTAQGVLTLWLITLAVFFVLRIAGGNPIEYMLPEDATAEDEIELTKAYGFDKPLIYQYWIYNKKLVRGDLGDAMGWDKRPAVDVVLERVPASLQLGGAALLFAIVVGVSVGAISASRPDSIFDRLGRVLAITAQSMPIFWVGILMILLFSVYLGWLPSAGGLDRLGPKGIILPGLSLGFFLIASHMRITRSTMLEVLESDYIKMVRAKGLPRRMVIWKHAFKNASIPVFTLFFVNFAGLISGAVITETIFSWPGVGRLLVDSLILRDFPTTQAVIFFSAAFILIVNIFVDVMYAWLDPRIRVT
jgi:ABC-type dipeptide/oligopeptide/nickel transport system permease component